MPISLHVQPPDVRHASEVTVTDCLKLLASSPLFLSSPQGGTLVLPLAGQFQCDAPKLSPQFTADQHQEMWLKHFLLRVLLNKLSLRQQLESH